LRTRSLAGSIIGTLESRFRKRQLDGASNHRSSELNLPRNISLLFLPPYAPELNPKENLWDEIREKIFKNYALKSIDAVREKLEHAILYLERNPTIVQSITSFPYIRKSY
jgi:transposase